MSSPESASYSLIGVDDPGPRLDPSNNLPLTEMHTYRESRADESSESDNDLQPSLFNTSRLPAAPIAERGEAPRVYVALHPKEQGEQDTRFLANLPDNRRTPGRFPSMSDLRRALPGEATKRGQSFDNLPDPVATAHANGGTAGPRRLTALDLPAPGARNAPKTFHGDCEEVEGFIDHYEKLIKLCNLATGRERCHNILLYCAPSVSEFIRVTTSYLRSDWEGLKGEIYKWYNAEVARKRYKPIHVAEYVKKHGREPIYNLTQWNKYYVGFKKRSGRLVSEKLMSPAKEAWYFKNGIHADLWEKIYATLSSLDPLHDPAVPYSVADICAAADVRLKRENFDDMQEDADRFGIAPEDLPSDSEEGSEPDSESDYSEREYRRRRREKRRKAERKHRKHRSEPTRKDRVTGPPEEVSTLVRQLNRLRTEEPSYPVIVLRDGQRAEGRESHAYAPALASQVRFANTDSLMRPPYSLPPAISRAPPPHMNGEYQPRPPPMPLEQTCFGCRRPGHRVRECEDLNRLIRENRAKRDPNTNRIVLANDAPVRTYQGESLVQAITRMTGSEPPRPTSLYAEAHERMGNGARAYYATVRKTEEDVSEDEARYSRDINAQALLSAYDLAAETDEELESSEEEDNREEEGEAEEEGKWIEDEKGQVYRVIRASMPATRNDRSAVGHRKEFMNEPVRRPGLRAPAPRQTVPSKYREFKKSDANRAAPPGNERKERDAGWPTRQSRASIIPGLKEGDKQVRLGNEELGVNDEGVTRLPAPQNAPPPPESLHEKPPRGTLPGPNPFELLPPLHPVNARRPRVRPEEGGVTIKNSQDLPARSHAQTDGAFEPSEDAAARGRGPARIAPITHETNPKEVVDKVLGQPITLTLREVIGVSSKQVQREFQEVMRPKSLVRLPTGGAAAVNIAGTSLETPSGPEVYAAQIDEDNLIRLDLLCEGTPVKAIIDTGSQLNVMRESLAQKILAGMPLDTAGALTMNDANGGEGYISGVMSQISLELGPIRTKTDIYLGAKVPFDLLLGRPWQRGNKISIDERDEGTYLIFRDQETGAKRYELRVPRHPKVRKGDKKPPAAMLLARAPPYKEEGSMGKDDKQALMGRDAFYVTSHQITPACSEAN